MNDQLDKYGGFTDGAVMAMLNQSFVERRARRLCGQLWGDYQAARLEAPDLCWAAAVTWAKASRPLWFIEPNRWRKIWRSAGYSIDGKPAQPPTADLTLYRAASTSELSQSDIRRWTRGQIQSTALGWSWTPSLDEAQYIARYRRGFGPEIVYTAIAPPKAVLAKITHTCEVIVDTALLTNKPQPCRDSNRPTEDRGAKG